MKPEKETVKKGGKGADTIASFPHVRMMIFFLMIRVYFRYF